MVEKLNERIHPSIRSHRASVWCLLPHQHRPDVKEFLKRQEDNTMKLCTVKQQERIVAKMSGKALPFPLSCLTSQQSSGRSWGRLGPCTRLCETVARCQSAPQTLCWQTTAEANKYDAKKGSQLYKHLLFSYTWNEQSVSLVPGLYASHSCEGNSGGRSLGSTKQFSGTSKRAAQDMRNKTWSHGMGCQVSTI